MEAPCPLKKDKTQFLSILTYSYISSGCFSSDASMDFTLKGRLFKVLFKNILFSREFSNEQNSLKFSKYRHLINSSFQMRSLSNFDIFFIERPSPWKALVKGERFIQPEKKPGYERPSKEIKVFTGKFRSYWENSCSINIRYRQCPHMRADYRKFILKSVPRTKEYMSPKKTALNYRQVSKLPH